MKNYTESKRIPPALAKHFSKEAQRIADGLDEMLAAVDESFKRQDLSGLTEKELSIEMIKRAAELGYIELPPSLH